MKKRFLPLLVATTFGISVFAQEDPVLMRINGKDITRSEFEYSYNKNNSDRSLDKKSLDDYVQLYINFKLKVAAAEEMRLDTLSSFKNELKGYRTQQAREYFVDTAFIESEARKQYEMAQRNIGSAGLVRSTHILLRIPQNAEPAVQEQIKVRMDSIYNALQNGADFAEMARKYSEDAGSAKQGGALPWLFAKQVYPEFAKEVYALQVNEMSKPFYSPVGIHIVKLLEKKQLEPYETQRELIYSFLERQGIRAKAIEVKKDSLYKQYGGKIKREDVLAHEDSLLEQKYPEFAHLMQEYYDGLLLFEVSNRCVWEKAAQDEEGLKRFFKKNKSKYVWDSPRYKGAVLYCANEDVAKVAKKALKKMPEEQWKSYLRKELNKDTLKLARMEKGLFKIGDNACVDYYIFKQGEYKKSEQYPCPVLIGKLRKKPEEYKDVRGPLTADYQNELEQNWIKDLRAKYQFEVYEDVLRTVNNH